MRFLIVKSVIVPSNYDYIGVFLTNNCHLTCPYCITKHNNSKFNAIKINELAPQEWIKGLNRFTLAKDLPLTLQGGEPFLYEGIWELLEKVEQKIDILTALPNFVTKKSFAKLNTLRWNKRNAPYPTIRVSYHKGQNDYKELIDRISELNEIVSIGIYYIENSELSQTEINNIKSYAIKQNVDVRSKEFIGPYKGKMFGTFKYPEGVSGNRRNIPVLCKNNVIPIAPDGTIYKCHTDLYFQNKSHKLGNILDNNLKINHEYTDCMNYGICNACDIKIKTNRYQQKGHTSVDIKFLNKKSNAQKNTTCSYN